MRWKSARSPLRASKPNSNRSSIGLRATGEREIKSLQVGECVMESLKALDHVAYVRFASVYRSFQDLAEFRDAIESLEAEPAEGDSP